MRQEQKAYDKLVAARLDLGDGGLALLPEEFELLVQLRHLLQLPVELVHLLLLLFHLRLVQLIEFSLVVELVLELAVLALCADPHSKLVAHNLTL